jgi:hypothetical protein
MALLEHQALDWRFHFYLNIKLRWRVQLSSSTTLTDPQEMPDKITSGFLIPGRFSPMLNASY